MALEELTRPRIEGITTITKQPATGWRDFLALMGTTFGMLTAGIGGALLLSSPFGLLLAPIAAWVGYRKQFWRTAFVRRPRLLAVDPPVAPQGTVYVGIAQPYERTIAKGSGKGALVVATSIQHEARMLARAIETVPFWLVIGERRVLVAGTAWAGSLRTETDQSLGAALDELGATKLPLTRVLKRRITIARTLISAGDSITLIGTLREEQLAGAGYRDTIAEVLRGEPGAPLWIRRL